MRTRDMQKMFNVMCEAYEDILVSKNWCQGAETRDKDGVPDDLNKYNLKVSKQRCAIGALKYASFKLYPRADAEKMMNTCAAYIEKQTPKYFTDKDDFDGISRQVELFELNDGEHSKYDTKKKARKAVLNAFVNAIDSLDNELYHRELGLK